MIKKFIQNGPQITLPFKICINFLLHSCKYLFKIFNICFSGNLQLNIIIIIHNRKVHNRATRKNNRFLFWKQMLHYFNAILMVYEIHFYFNGYVNKQNTATTFGVLKSQEFIIVSCIL